MPGVRRIEIPEQALHRRYLAEGAYADCYAVVVDRRVTLAGFVEAFYTSWLFRLERWILAWTVDKPSSDDDARWLANGDLQAFAAWTVEARAPDQLLMCDYLGATRSWFMVFEVPDGATRLHFGSVVTARTDPRTGRRALGRTYRWLLGFHKLYSRALLRAAAARLVGER